MTVEYMSVISDTNKPIIHIAYHKPILHTTSPYYIPQADIIIQSHLSAQDWSLCFLKLQKRYQW